MQVADGETYHVTAAETRVGKEHLTAAIDPIDQIFIECINSRIVPPQTALEWLESKRR